MIPRFYFVLASVAIAAVALAPWPLPPASPALAASKPATDADISEAKDLVKAYIRRQFPATADNIAITFAGTLPHLLDGAVYVSADNKPGTYSIYRYIVFNRHVYDDGAETGLSLLLKDYDYFNKLDLDAEQLFLLLELIGHTGHMLYMEAIYPNTTYYPYLHPPRLSQSKDGLVLTFFGNRGDDNGAPSEWTMTVSPDYRIEIKEVRKH